MSVLASGSLLKIILIPDNTSIGTLKGTLTVSIEKACWLRERIAVYFERDFRNAGTVWIKRMISL